MAELLNIRPLARGDVPGVCDLWSAYVSEGFIDNFTGPAEGDGESADVTVHVSLDRWGPGVAMPMLPDAPRPHMQREPSYAVAQHVAAMVGHRSCHCLVAELTGTLVGFVSYEIRTLDTMAERVASIEELFVLPIARRCGIGTALLTSALDDLRSERIGVFRALVPGNERHAGARALFAGAGWEPDKIAFGLYD